MGNAQSSESDSAAALEPTTNELDGHVADTIDEDEDEPLLGDPLDVQQPQDADDTALSKSKSTPGTSEAGTWRGERRPAAPPPVPPQQVALGIFFEQLDANVLLVTTTEVFVYRLSYTPPQPPPSSSPAAPSSPELSSVSSLGEISPFVVFPKSAARTPTRDDHANPSRSSAFATHTEPIAPTSSPSVTSTVSGSDGWDRPSPPVERPQSSTSPRAQSSAGTSSKDSSAVRTPASSFLGQMASSVLQLDQFRLLSSLHSSPASIHSDKQQQQQQQQQQMKMKN